MTDNEKIIHRYAYHDPDLVAEVREDKLSNRRWITLWLHQDGEWGEYVLDSNKVSLLESLMKSCRKLIRPTEK